MQASIATVTIEGMSPLSHSRDHGDPHLQGESHDAYDLRTWRSKLNTAERDGKMTVVIPAHGIHQALMSACKYSKDQIPGQGKATWTAKFTSGIAFFEDPSLNIDPETVKSIRLSQNADGVRGSARRVLRTFPIMPVWSSTFDVYILDPIITHVLTDLIVRLHDEFRRKKGARQRIGMRFIAGRGAQREKRGY